MYFRTPLTEMRPNLSAVLLARGATIGTSLRRRKPLMKTLVLANQKGGVGKSAVATLLTHYLAQQGQRVLAVDLDHQGNFSKPVRLSGKADVLGVSADTLLTEPGDVSVAALRASPSSRPVIVVPSSSGLMTLERQRELHNDFGTNLRNFLRGVSADAQLGFDVCVIDTNPNPDIRLISALASADFVLSPIQLNQEALDGVAALLNHQRVGLRKIKVVLNPTLNFIGLLPTLVEATPFQKANYLGLIARYQLLMIPLSPKTGHFACIPKRSVIAEAQASGEVMWTLKKTAARDTWNEIAPSLARITEIIHGQGEPHVNRL
jgi:chromosome partitioning protein